MKSLLLSLFTRPLIVVYVGDQLMYKYTLAGKTYWLLNPPVKSFLTTDTGVGVIWNFWIKYRVCNAPQYLNKGKYASIYLQR